MQQRPSQYVPLHDGRATAETAGKSTIARPASARAPTRRALMGQAQGILMHREGVSADQALRILNRISARSGRTLADIARYVIAACIHPDVQVSGGPDRSLVYLETHLPGATIHAPRPGGGNDTLTAGTAQLHVMGVTHPSVVALSGEIDAATAPRLWAQLLTLPPDDLVVDLSQVTFLGVAGLNLLLRLRDLLGDYGTDVRLASAPPEVVRVIRLAQVQSALPCWPTVAEAVDSWANL